MKIDLRGLFNMKTILVTGGTGLLGSAFKSIESDFPNYKFIYWNNVSGYRQFDLRLSEDTIYYMRNINPDYVIHCAAIVGGVGISAKYPATLLRDNVRMDLNVLESARLCRVEKVIMTLSTGMYPEYGVPVYIDEECIHDGYPHESNYAYAFAKRLIDPMIKAYRQEYGMNVIGLVPNGIFGENDYFGLEDSTMTAALIRRFYESKIKGHDPVLWGDGTPLREITYSQDLARAYMWCLENYDDEQILNVGTTEENSVNDIALMIAEEMDIDPERIKWDTTKLSGPYRKSTDNSRFIGLSNFKYTSFRQGLNKTILWYKNMMETEPEKIRTGSKIRS